MKKLSLAILTTLLSIGSFAQKAMEIKEQQFSEGIESSLQSLFGE